MLIKSALAAAEKAVAPTDASVIPATTGGNTAMSQTILFTVVLVVLFYFLLIRPQQKRYKEHSDMLGQLGKGDKIITQGGMVGVIEQLPNEKEALIDFGNNIKMTVLRSYIMGKYDLLGNPSKTDKK